MKLHDEQAAYVSCTMPPGKAMSVGASQDVVLFPTPSLSSLHWLSVSRTSKKVHFTGRIVVCASDVQPIFNSKSCKQEATTETMFGQC